MVEDPLPTGARRRRPPPPFRRVTVQRAEPLGERMVRATLGGDELDGLVVAEPAASVRVLLPPDAHAEVVVPEWNGNEFLLADGTRPVIRTLTPARADERARELDVWVVVHGQGRAARWASQARSGTQAAVSGPGRGFAVDPDVRAWLLVGDETALAAMAQLLETISPASAVTAHIEAPPEGRIALPSHAGDSVVWHEPVADGAPGDALVAAVAGASLSDDTRVWAAGEAAAMQRLRRHLLDERALPRARCTVRGYWKVGRSAEGTGEDT